jgi:hypothetical protein
MQFWDERNRLGREFNTTVIKMCERHVCDMRRFWEERHKTPAHLWPVWTVAFIFSSKRNKAGLAWKMLTCENYMNVKPWYWGDPALNYIRCVLQITFVFKQTFVRKIFVLYQCQSIRSSISSLQMAVHVCTCRPTYKFLSAGLAVFLLVMLELNSILNSNSW